MGTAWPEIDLKNVRVLIVEDDTDLLNYLCDFINQLKAKVFCATNLRSAINILSENKIDLVISDVLLSDGSAIDLLQFVRNEMKAIPVTLMTAYSQLSSDEAISLGAKGLLHKPFNSMQLLELLSKPI